jgi:3-deoxy-7-phosphoheptulonate synthase
MNIILKKNTEEQAVAELLSHLSAQGVNGKYVKGSEQSSIIVVRDQKLLDRKSLLGNSIVDQVKPILAKYKQVGLEFHHHDTIIKLGNTQIGGGKFHVLSGPCAIESSEQAIESGRFVSEFGGHSFRGGIYKPRTSPYSFQGYGEAGLDILKMVKEQTDLPIVSEVINISDIDKMIQTVDGLQIGARNMQNYALLEAVGKTKHPIFLKRGMSATIEEFLLAAEYIYNQGNENIILCERGIRTFETATRNTLDLNAVAYIKQKSHLPVLVDPSHGTGVRELVTPLSKAALAVGADGIMVEMHPNPDEALSDGPQSLTPKLLEDLINELAGLAPHFGKTI